MTDFCGSYLNKSMAAGLVVTHEPRADALADDGRRPDLVFHGLRVKGGASCDTSVDITIIDPTSAAHAARDRRAPGAAAAHAAQQKLTKHAANEWSHYGRDFVPCVFETHGHRRESVEELVRLLRPMAVRLEHARDEVPTVVGPLVGRMLGDFLLCCMCGRGARRPAVSRGVRRGSRINDSDVDARVTRGPTLHAEAMEDEVRATSVGRPLAH